MAEFINHLLSAISLHPRKQNWNFFIFVINDNQASIFHINRVVGPFGEKLDFFSPLGFKAKRDFGHKTSILKSHSINASE